MPTRTFDYGHGVSHPGLTGAQSPADMMFPPGSPASFFASNPMSRRFGKAPFQGIGNGLTYSTLDWTATTTGTSAAAAASTSGGVLLTCGSDSTFNTNLQSINLWAPTVQKRIQGLAILQTSDITTVGFEYSFGTSAVDPATTNYTDCIKLKMAVGAGAVIGAVRGGSGTQAVTSTLYTATAATDFVVGFDANLGELANQSTTVTTGASSTTQTLGSTFGISAGDVLYFATTAVYAAVASVTNSTTLVVGTSISTTTGEVVTVYKLSGGFWTGALALSPNGALSGLTYTPFSSAQLVQLAKIVRASPSMYHNLSAKGSASTPTVLFKVAQMERDRN